MSVSASISPIPRAISPDRLEELNSLPSNTVTTMQTIARQYITRCRNSVNGELKDKKILITSLPGSRLGNVIGAINFSYIFSKYLKPSNLAISLPQTSFKDHELFKDEIRRVKLFTTVENDKPNLLNFEPDAVIGYSCDSISEGQFESYIQSLGFPTIPIQVSQCGFKPATGGLALGFKKNELGIYIDKTVAKKAQETIGWKSVERLTYLKQHAPELYATIADGVVPQEFDKKWSLYCAYSNAMNSRIWFAEVLSNLHHNLGREKNPCIVLIGAMGDEAQDLIAALLTELDTKNISLDITDPGNGIMAKGPPNDKRVKLVILPEIKHSDMTLLSLTSEVETLRAMGQSFSDGISSLRTICPEVLPHKRNSFRNFSETNHNTPFRVAQKNLVADPYDSDSILQASQALHDLSQNKEWDQFKVTLCEVVDCEPKFVKAVCKKLKVNLPSALKI